MNIPSPLEFSGDLHSERRPIHDYQRVITPVTCVHFHSTHHSTFTQSEIALATISHAPYKHTSCSTFCQLLSRLNSSHSFLQDQLSNTPSAVTAYHSLEPTLKMKTLSLLLCISSIFLSSASPITNPTNLTARSPPQIPTHERRGIAYNNAKLLSLFAQPGSHITWRYNWDSSTASSPTIFDFTPMLHSVRSDHTKVWKTNVEAVVQKNWEKGRATWVLGFNEPDDCMYVSFPPFPLSPTTPSDSRENETDKCNTQTQHRWFLHRRRNHSCSVETVPVATCCVQS